MGQRVATRWTAAAIGVTAAPLVGAPASLALPIFTLKPAVVSRARYVRHKIRPFLATNDEFRIRVTPGGDPENPAPVYVVLRARGGTTSPPSLRARPLLKRKLSAVFNLG